MYQPWKINRVFPLFWPGLRITLHNQHREINLIVLSSRSFALGDPLLQHYYRAPVMFSESLMHLIAWHEWSRYDLREKKCACPWRNTKATFWRETIGIFFSRKRFSSLRTRGFSFSHVKEAVCDHSPKFMTLSTTLTMRIFGVAGIISYIP